MKIQYLKSFQSIAVIAPLVVLFSFLHIRKNEKSLDLARTESGMVAGIRNEQKNVTAFKGIPFALPPVGNMRWKAPAAPQPWTGTRKCGSFGPSPMQPKPVSFLMLSPEFLIPDSPMSEDCLYLNVWTAATSATEKRPVFIWIYGGGFTTGGAAAPAYDGEALASKGVVFVSFNYRLGIFGFLSHPELTAESPQHSSGNYGLLDQIAALQWIKKNIAAFGGDPNNVTIDGQSAGSMSVNCLLASPLAKGLFHRAIAESGNLILPNTFIKTPNLQSAEDQGKKWAAKLNKPTINELRNIPATELLHEGMGLYGPVVDGLVLDASIPDTYAKGNQNHVPLIVGWNAGEGIVFAVKSREEFAKTLRQVFGDDYDAAQKLYPSDTEEENLSSQFSLSRDMLIGVSTYKWAEMESSTGSKNVYVYNFTRKPPPNDKLSKYGAFHTAEIPFALDNLHLFNRPWEEVDKNLSATMSDYWVQFAKTGNPNAGSLSQWPAFTRQENMTMIFKEHPSSGKMPDKKALDLLFSKYPGPSFDK